MKRKTVRLVSGTFGDIQGCFSVILPSSGRGFGIDAVFRERSIVSKSVKARLVTVYGAAALVLAGLLASFMVATGGGVFCSSHSRYL